MRFPSLRTGLSSALSALVSRPTFFLALSFSLLLLFPLSVPAAHAADEIIERGSVSFTGGGITDAGYVLPDATVSATMQFTVNPGYDRLAIIFGDENAGTPYSVDVASCPDRTCLLGVELTPVTAGSQAEVVFHLFDQSGAEERNVKYAFKVDTQPPTILAIGTASAPRCGAGTNGCALKPGVASPIVVTYTDGLGSTPGSGIAPSTIQLLLVGTGQPVGAQWCNATQCNFTITAPDTNGDSTLRIMDTSGDVMGNKVRSSNLEQLFTTDGLPPEILSIEKSPKPDELAVTGKFQLKVKVDDASAVSATLALGPLGNATTTELTVPCPNKICTFTITPRSPTETEGSYPGVMTLAVSDSAGNTVTQQTQEYRVYQLSEESADFWQVDTRAQPSSIDVASLAYFGKTIYLPLEFRAAGGSPSLEVVYTAVKSCSYFTGLAANEAGTSDTPDEQEEVARSSGLGTPTVLNAGSPYPIVALPFTQSDLFTDITGDVRVECTVELTSADGSYYYDKPQSVTVGSRIELKRNPLITQKLAQLQADSDKSLQESRDKLQEWKTLYSIASTICNAQNGLAAGSVLAANSEFLLSNVPVVGQGASESMRVTGTAMSRAGEAMTRSPYFGPLCEMMACRGGPLLDNDFFHNTIMPGIKPGSGMGKVLDSVAQGTVGNEADVAFISPQRSWIIAYATGCIPAILYHEDTRLGIKCEYNQCLHEKADLGLPVSACQAQKSNQECRYLYGGIFYASPLAVVQIIRDNILSILTNPIAAGVYISDLVCEHIPSNFGHALCKIPNAVKKADEITRLIIEIKAAISQFSPPENVQCKANDDAIEAIETRRLLDGAQCSALGCCYKGVCGSLSQRIGANEELGTEKFTRVYYRVADQRESCTAVSDVDLTTVATQKKLCYVAAPPDDVQGKIDARLDDFTKNPYDALESGDTADKAAATRWEAARKPAVDARETLAALTVHDAALRADYARLRNKLDELQGQSQNPEKLEKAPDDFDKSIREEMVLRTKEYMATANSRCPLSNPRCFYSAADEFLLEKTLADGTPVATTLAADIDFQFNPSTGVTAEKRKAAIAAAQADVEVKEKEERTAARAAAKRLEYLAQKNNWVLNFQSAARSAHAADRLTSLFGLNNVRFESGEIESKTDLYENVVGALCEENNLRRQDGVIGVDGNRRIGLYLLGSRTQTIQLSEGTEDITVPYTYLATGSVTMPREMGSNYSVTFESGSDSYQVREGELRPGSSIGWGGSDILRHQNETLYTDVCITFGDHAIEDLFEHHGDFSGHKACVPLKEVQES